MTNKPNLTLLKGGKVTRPASKPTSSIVPTPNKRTDRPSFQRVIAAFGPGMVVLDQAELEQLKRQWHATADRFSKLSQEYVSRAVTGWLNPNRPPDPLTDPHSFSSYLTLMAALLEGLDLIQYQSELADYETALLEHLGQVIKEAGLSTTTYKRLLKSQVPAVRAGLVTIALQLGLEADHSFWP